MGGRNHAQPRGRAECRVRLPSEGAAAEAGIQPCRAGLIRYSRGRIAVLDRPGLERDVCKCYAVVKKEFDRLLTDIPLGYPFQSVGGIRSQ